ncbi:hypothetical protein BH18THE2_BH18THE2_35110 [soil metagenome]
MNTLDLPIVCKIIAMKSLTLINLRQITILDNLLNNKKESFGEILYPPVWITVYCPKQSPLGFDTSQLLSENVFTFTFGASPFALFMSTTLSCAPFN